MTVAKVSEITAESTDSFDDAIRQGIARANQTIENVQSVWIKDQTIVVKDGKPSRYRVSMKVTFVLK